MTSDLFEGWVTQLHDGSGLQVLSFNWWQGERHLLTKRGVNGPADLSGIRMRTAQHPMRGLSPLLARHGNDPRLRLIFFCLDQSAFCREIAPMAGFWPALLIGPPWWFHHSPRGIALYLDPVVESAGFFKLACFNDDTRAMLSVPARHDVWRRGVASFLAGMVARRTLRMTDAHAVAAWLSVEAARAAYRLPHPANGPSNSMR